MQHSVYFNKQLHACTINQTIASEAYVLKSDFDLKITLFDISGNKEVKYLPSRIGEKFPNLKECNAALCSLTVIRDHYFKDMRKVQHLDLSFNNIATIEHGSFDDLVLMKRLSLHFNMIETLDESVFAKLVSLELLYIDQNKIKYLSPATFSTQGPKLKIHDWEKDALQFAKGFNTLLESEITPNITQNIDQLDFLIKKFRGFGKSKDLIQF